MQYEVAIIKSNALTSTYTHFTLIFCSWFPEIPLHFLKNELITYNDTQNPPFLPPKGVHKVEEGQRNKLGGEKQKAKRVRNVFYRVCQRQPFQDLSFLNYEHASHLFAPSAWNALVCSFRCPQHVLLMGWFRHVGVTGFTLQHAEWASWSILWAGENRFFFTLSWITTGIPRNKEGGKCPATGHHGPLSPKWPLGGNRGLQGTGVQRRGVFFQVLFYIWFQEDAEVRNIQVKTSVTLVRETHTEGGCHS